MPHVPLLDSVKNPSGPMKIVVAAVLAMVVVVLSPASPAGADVPKVQNCGTWSPYIEDLDVIATSSSGDGYEISIEPTKRARKEGLMQSRYATVQMWHVIQMCVPGLYGDRADTIWQQLECHQMYSTPDLTGDRYNLESYRPVLSESNWLTYINTHCSNQAWLLGGPTGDPSKSISNSE